MESLKLYLKEVRNIPLLTAKEEVDLSRKAKKGDEYARKKMIRSNLSPGHQHCQEVYVPGDTFSGSY